MTVIETTQHEDGSPMTLAWTSTEHGDTISVQVWLGHDGVPVVQIDTPEKIGRVRINLNEGAIWDGNPETDRLPGANWEARVR